MKFAVKSPSPSTYNGPKEFTGDSTTYPLVTTFTVRGEDDGTAVTTPITDSKDSSLFESAKVYEPLKKDITLPTVKLFKIAKGTCAVVRKKALLSAFDSPVPPVPERS